MPLQMSITNEEAPKYLTLARAQRYLDGLENRIHQDKNTCCDDMYLAAEFSSGKFACLNCKKKGTIEISTPQWHPDIANIENQFLIVTGRFIKIGSNGGSKVKLSIETVAKKNGSRSIVETLIGTKAMGAIGKIHSGAASLWSGKAKSQMRKAVEQGEDIPSTKKGKVRQAAVTKRCLECGESIPQKQVRCSKCVDSLLGRWNGNTVNLPTTNANIRVPTGSKKEAKSEKVSVIHISKNASRLFSISADDGNGSKGKLLKGGFRNLHSAQTFAKKEYPKARIAIWKEI